MSAVMAKTTGSTGSLASAEPESSRSIMLAESAQTMETAGSARDLEPCYTRISCSIIITSYQKLPFWLWGRPR